MKKLYVLSCKKLSKKQQFVQGTHACIEWARVNNEHPPLVMLQCEDIEGWSQLLTDRLVTHYTFRDSYYDGRMTALASTEIGEMVRELKLI